MTITEFLLARIAEDEYEANVCLDQYRRGDGGSTPRWVRQLAECEAKRRIIEACEAGCECHAAGIEASVGGCVIDVASLRALAQVYADHPDYREEWRRQ